MAPRATWKGYLKLSLVSCPVRMYNATTGSERVSFHLLHKDTHNRIRMVPHDPEIGRARRPLSQRGSWTSDRENCQFVAAQYERAAVHDVRHGAADD